MITISDRSEKKVLLLALSVLVASFAFAGSCHATVNKSTASVVVSTKDQGNWYDLSDKGLHTFAVCDGSSSYDSGKYSFTTGCNSNGKHDDYLYTDTADERNLNVPGQNFVIKASASASSGSITKIKLEWIYGVDSVPSDSSWTNSGNHPGSATCDNKGSCTFCIEGGKCDKPSIPKAALSVKDSGAQSRFHFRVTFVSSTGDSVTSGVDGTLSKFHSFVICGPKCHGCDDYAPIVTPASVSAPADFCNGLNDTNGYYTVSWKDENMINGTKQTYYKLSVRKKGTTSVQSKEANSADTSTRVPSSWLSYDSVYEWQITAKFEGPGCTWTVTSPWSTDATNIKVPRRYPVPKMSIVNDGGANCLSKGACYQSENLKFDGSTSTISAGSASYSWTVDKASYSTASFNTQLSGDKHNVTLKVTDGDNHYCSIQKQIELAKSDTPPPSCATGLKVSVNEVYDPQNPCAGLNDTDGFYIVSWTLPKNMKQSHYKVTVENKNNSKDTNSFEKDSADTMARIPSSYLKYENSYKWKVEVKITSADGKCPYALVSDWSSGDADIAVPARYPQPDFSVKHIINEYCGSCQTDCLTDTCETGKELTFNGSSSKVHTGNATYSWVLDGDPYAGEIVKESFDGNKVKAILTVTDGANNSCSIEKEVDLKDPDCPGSPAVSLAGVDEQGDYCAGMKSFRLNWKINPANFKQESYTITVQNVKDPGDNYTKTENSPSTVVWVPTEEINWDSEYSWQVKVNLVSANGKCKYSDVPSPLSGGAENIRTPYEYPRPVITVVNQDGKNCFSGECLEGDTFKFYGGSSFVNPAAKATGYDWVVDGNARSGIEFSEQLPGVSHEAALSITDDYGSYQQTCSSGQKIFVSDMASATNSQAGWNEIAPH